MAYFKEQALVKIRATALAQFLVLAGVATVVPFFIHIQWITGPMVNALLIIALLLIGVRSALLLCLIPSLMALAGGLLPSALAPVVPFIMISNALFVLVIEYFYKSAKNQITGYWFGVVMGAGVKYLFLYFNTNLIIGLIMKKELAGKVAIMMSWSQLATAIAGGFIAFAILKYLKRI